jgi:hypothetical protein
MNRILFFLIPFSYISCAHALPECKGHFDPKTWHNCVGTLSHSQFKYVGEFKNGRFGGKGIYTRANGDKYVGEFKSGKFNGTYTRANGDKYVGEVRDGKPHGYGTYYFLADNQRRGDKYVGDFKSGKFNGQGTLTYADGDKLVGEWKDNKYIGR